MGTLLQLSIGPRFPGRQLCRPEDLKNHVQNSSMPWRGYTFPDPGSPTLSQHESAIVLDAAKGTSFFETNVWGILFYGAHVRVESSGTTGINLSAFIGYILLFIRQAAKMLQLLGYSGAVAIEMALSPILKVNWLHSWAGYVQGEPGSELDDEITLVVPTASDSLREKPDGVAMEVLRHLFFSVNCPNLVDTPEKLDRLVLKGYEYNGWPPPQDRAKSL